MLAAASGIVIVNFVVNLIVNLVVHLESQTQKRKEPKIRTHNVCRALVTTSLIEILELRLWCFFCLLCELLELIPEIYPCGSS